MYAPTTRSKGTYASIRMGTRLTECPLRTRRANERGRAEEGVARSSIQSRTGVTQGSTGIREA